MLWSIAVFYKLLSISRINKFSEYVWLVVAKIVNDLLMLALAKETIVRPASQELATPENCVTNLE